MKKLIILFLLLTFGTALLSAQKDKHYSIISSAGKWDSNNKYKHYFVMGEPIVKDIVAIGALRTAIGFLSPDTGYLEPGEVVIYQDSKFQVYPNPTNGLLMLKGENLDYDLTEIRIMNILGEELLHQKLSASETISQQINLEKLSQGLYLLKITRGSKMSIYKVIKE